MILVAGSVPVRPDRREDAIRVAKRMRALTEAEAGCLSYRFYSSLNDPNLFFIFEEWEDEDALADHFLTEHMAWFQEQLPDLVAGPSEITRYQVTGRSSM